MKVEGPFQVYILIMVATVCREDQPQIKVIARTIFKSINASEYYF
jgi:hypothetical protein